MTFFKRKRYNIFVKFIAVALFIFAILMIIVTISLVEDAKNSYIYGHYYEWDIVDHSIEELEDRKHRITFDIKNISAYNAYIYDYNIRLEYGNGNVINVIKPTYSHSSIYDTLQEKFIPPGETIKYSLIFEKPDELRSIRATYMGASYTISNARKTENPYKYYDIDLK